MSRTREAMLGTVIVFGCVLVPWLYQQSLPPRQDAQRTAYEQRGRDTRQGEAIGRLHLCNSYRSAGQRQQSMEAYCR